MRKLAPGPDTELPEHLSQVVLHRTGADEQLLGDLPVSRAFGGQVSHAGFLRGEVELSLRAPRPGSLAGSTKFVARLCSEAVGAHGVIHTFSGAQLAASVPSPFGASQPLAVDQVCARQIDSGDAVLKLADCFDVCFLRALAVTDESQAAGAYPTRPGCARSTGTVAQGGERADRRLAVAAADGGVNKHRQRVVGREHRIVFDHRQGGVDRRLALTSTESRARD